MDSQHSSSKLPVIRAIPALPAGKGISRIAIGSSAFCFVTLKNQAAPKCSPRARPNAQQFAGVAHSARSLRRKGHLPSGVTAELHPIGSPHEEPRPKRRALLTDVNAHLVVHARSTLALQERQRFE